MCDAYCLCCFFCTESENESHISNKLCDQKMLIVSIVAFLLSFPCGKSAYGGIWRHWNAIGLFHALDFNSLCLLTCLCSFIHFTYCSFPSGDGCVKALGVPCSYCMRGCPSQGELRGSSLQSRWHRKVRLHGKIMESQRALCLWPTVKRIKA